MTDDQERLIRTAAMIAARVELTETFYDNNSEGSTVRTLPFYQGAEAVADRSLSIARCIIDKVRGR